MKKIILLLFQFTTWYFRGHDESKIKRGIALAFVGLLIVPASMYCYTFVAKARYTQAHDLPPQTLLAPSPIHYPASPKPWRVIPVEPDHAVGGGK